MIRFFASLAVSLTTVSAVAQGPLIKKIIGEPNKDKSWMVCTVRPTIVTLVAFTAGQPPQVETQNLHELGTAPAKLSADIAQAVVAKELHALHVRETVPHIRVLVGNLPTIKPTTILYDASTNDYRSGDAAARLIEKANEHCGRMHPDMRD